MTTNDAPPTPPPRFCTECWYYQIDHYEGPQSECSMNTYARVAEVCTLPPTVRQLGMSLRACRHWLDDAALANRLIQKGWSPPPSHVRHPLVCEDESVPLTEEQIGQIAKDLLPPELVEKRFRDLYGIPEEETDEPGRD